MNNFCHLFEALQITTPSQVKEFSRKCGLNVKELKYYNEERVFPIGEDLRKIVKASGKSEIQLRLELGVFNEELLSMISKNAKQIQEILPRRAFATPNITQDIEHFKTDLGKVFKQDCMEMLRAQPSKSVDLIFADPPFNLSKHYPSKIDDNLKEKDYISWSKGWIDECIRLLKPGGSFFLWNIPKWNIIFSEYMRNYLTFKHWIGVEFKNSLPVSSRLYPSHYSLLYFVKGKKPKSFHPDRLPMQVCQNCFKELKDYGGYKNKMNPKGVNLSDVWIDISPVRHAKFKRRKGSNELSVKLLDRVIEMASDEGDIILDPFGGSGTTYIVSELKNRHWLGCEIGDLDIIKARFDLIESEAEILKSYRDPLNELFPEKIKQERKKRGLWIPEDFSGIDCSN